MRSIWFLILLGSLFTYHCFTTVSGEAQQSIDASRQPTFDQCKGYVDAALKTSSPEDETSQEGTEEQASAEDGGEPPDSKEEEDGGESTEQTTEDEDSTQVNESQEDATNEDTDDGEASQEEDQSAEDGASNEDDQGASDEETATAEEATEEDATQEDVTQEDATQEDDATQEASQEDDDETQETSQEENATQEDATQEDATEEAGDQAESAEADQTESAEDEATAEQDDDESKEEGADTAEDTAEEDTQESAEQDGGEEESAEEGEASEQASEEDGTTAEDDGKSEEDDQPADGDTQEDTGEAKESDEPVSSDVADEADQSESAQSQEDEAIQEDQATTEDTGSPEAEAGGVSEEGASEEDAAADEGSEEEDVSEEEEVEPYEPRSRDHITQILGLDDSEQTKNAFSLLDKATQSTLKELKSTYEGAIKPLEQLYKYRDLSNRHFGDPEIFSKPLVVFMGPWSGGKSTIINWLLGIQQEDTALRTGADPSPAQFNIMMYGKEPEKLDGTQLAADWTFSGLQKFGQSFLDRLRGQKLPNRLLEKVNIVEIPGILEVRKQVERSFPFNDACQWFIDRADTLFLVYDPAKLDIGPETEAILDQLKGRENQVRIVLNKADSVKPDELLRVQAMLVWNISPLMSSAEPPVMYAASLWDRPLQVESPKSLLVAHENHFLKDIRDAIERRVETRIAAARRFAVRVRNHAKMVDCYLNTYNNHRSFFSDKKKVTTDIIDHPQNYHIYEGLSTLTNISRYDLPDPDTYRDFFRINPLWDFPSLSSTCSFFRGCPLHKLDIAIAYDLPEILGKFRRQREAISSARLQQANP